MSKAEYAKCDYDCFSCKFEECRNNAPPTAAENKILKGVLKSIKAIGG